jgi:glucokinase
MGQKNMASIIGAVDIGGTKIAVGVVDAQGRVLRKTEFPTDATTGFDGAMHRVSGALSECTEVDRDGLQGIGIGCTGQVDALSGKLSNVHNLPNWEGRNPVDFVSCELNVPVAMENDADAAALGEMHYGAAKGKSPFVYVTIGTGIGVSVLLDGQIYRGVNQCHPEIGHHIVEPSGPLCSCGARGCWESLASGPSMTEWIRKNAPANYGSEPLSALETCTRAQDGDEWARRAVENEAYYLGVGLANLIVLFAPDAIVLGGSVMKSAFLFWEGIQKVIQKNCRLVPYEQIDITLASLGDDVALIGAAEVWRQRFSRCEAAGRALTPVVRSAQP